ncbi:MAG: LysR family transcriptional regulator, partial [Gracilibacteraceae bacterium]|nr:LysR family transcriptional regulator [Gracilibacteraceae bacterium]
MRIEHMRYFISLAETRSIHRAAETLYISPQAMSKIIQSMEKELGVTLLIRSRTGVILSEAGAKFLPVAQEIVDRYKHFISDFSKYDNSPHLRGGNLHILTQPRNLETFVYDAIKIFTRKNLPETLVVKTFNPLEIVERMARSEADIGVIKIGR